MDQLDPNKRKVVWVYIGLLFILIVVLWFYFFKINLQKSKQEQQQTNSASLLNDLKNNFASFRNDTSKSVEQLKTKFNELQQTQEATTTVDNALQMSASTSEEFLAKVKNKLETGSSTSVVEIKK